MNARTVWVVVSLLGAHAGCSPHAEEESAQVNESSYDSTLAQSASPWRGLAGSLAQRAAGFTVIGSDAESSPAIAASDAGRIDVFVRGARSTLRHLAYGSGHGQWEDLGGTVQGDPAAVSSARGRVDVFARGTDNALWQRTLEGDAWSRWHSLGGSLASGPAAASGAPGEIDVVARSTGGGLVHRQYRDGAWGSWRHLDGGNLASDPAIVFDDEGYIHLAARAASGNMVYRRYETGWSSWQVVPGGDTAQSAPALAAGSGKVVGYVRGGDSALWTISYKSGRWSPTRRLGGSLAQSPDAVYRLGRIEVVIVGPDKLVYHRAYDTAAAGSSGPEGKGDERDDRKGIDDVSSSNGSSAGL